LLQNGDTYPSSKDSKRITKENYYESLLLNKPISYEWKDVNGTLTKVPKDPLVPIPQTIADISADLLLGEFPNIILPDNRQDAWDDWAFDNDLGSRMLEAGTYVSAIGTVFSNIFQKDNEILFELFPGNKVTWVEKGRKIVAVQVVLNAAMTDDGSFIIYEIMEWSDDNGLLIEHYTAKVRLADRKVVETVLVNEPERPGLDFVPVAKWLNVGVMGQESGRSDFSGKSQLFTEIDNRFDQNNSTIEENQDPWKGMPPGVLNENGDFNRANYSLKMFEKTMGGQADNTVDFFTWDANMPASFQQIEAMVDMTFFTARLSNSLVGREKGGVSESGRALKWKSVSTITQKQRKEKYASTFLRNFINQWSKLDGEEIDKKDIRIEWQDGLPIDEQEKTETIVQQVNAGLMSKETAISQLQEINTEDAQAELQRIQADETFTAQTEATTLTPINV
jgi:hypothetical protein